MTHIVIVSLLLLFVIRLLIVRIQRGWVIEYMLALFDEYLEDERRQALKQFYLLKDGEHEYFWQQVEERMSRALNIKKVYSMYPSDIDLAFSLNKWSHHQMFPYLYMNMALGLSGKMDEIDVDLIK